MNPLSNLCDKAYLGHKMVMMHINIGNTEQFDYVTFQNRYR